MKIFIVTSHLPYPGVAHGGGTSMVSNIRYLSVRNEVLLASMYEAGERDRLGAMAEHATLVVAEQTITGTQLNAAAGVQQEAAAGGWALNRLILRSLLGWLLRTFLDCDLRPKPAPETARFLRDVLAKIDELRPDIVQVEFLQLGALLEPGLRAKGIPAVIVAQDVEMKQMHRRLCRAPWGPRRLLAYFRYRNLRHLELKVYSKFQRVYTVSEFDKSILQREDGALRVAVRPHTMAIPAVAPAITRSRGMVLFVGAMFRPENIESARFILGEVWPEVRRACPGAELHIVGGGVTEEIGRQHNGRDIFVHGYVPDLATFYLRARVMVAPLFLGGGVIIKVFEALAYGLPTVATPIANEGVSAAPDQEILLARTAPEFSSGIVRLLQEDALWQRLAQGGQRLIQTVYHPDRVAEALERDYETIIKEFKSRP